jgi:hypothetical protein
LKPDIKASNCSSTRFMIFHSVIDLIPGGRDIPVTNENKPQYIE